MPTDVADRSHSINGKRGGMGKLLVLPAIGLLVVAGSGGTLCSVGSGLSYASARIELVSSQGGHTTVRSVHLPGNLPATGGGGPAGMPGVAGLIASAAILLGGWKRRRSRLAL